jgi:origin recognition complex subunit 3
LWDQQQTRIDETVTQLDNDALKNIMHFAEEAGQHTIEGNLQAGLIVSGSDTSVQVRLLGQWRTARSTSTELVCELRSSSCQNLQTALKNIIKTTISEVIGQDGYLDYFAKHKRLIPMNFDLELLELFVKQYNTSRVVISMLDVETFDTNILSELISTLSSWSGRIPFVALIGIATTVELFELRLPKSVIRSLEAKVFTLSSPSNALYNILSDMQISKDSSLLFGPATVSMLHDMSQNQSTTIESFTKMLKCVYMSHFFANCLSVLLGDLEIEATNASILCEAIRNTESFQNHCEELLSQGKLSLSTVRGLLDDDAILLDAASSAISSGQDDYRSAVETVIAISDLWQRVKPSGKELVFQIDLKLYSSLDDLASSEVFEELTLGLEELKSSEILDSLAATQDTTKAILGIEKTSHSRQRQFTL